MADCESRVCEEECESDRKTDNTEKKKAIERVFLFQDSGTRSFTDFLTQYCEDEVIIFCKAHLSFQEKPSLLLFVSRNI